MLGFLTLFRGCLRMEVAKRLSLRKIFHTYPTMMKLATVISYLKKTQKFINYMTQLLSYANISIFSP